LIRTKLFIIGKVTIPAILAELDGLEKFNHVRELMAFIGLAPKETLSGSSIKGKLNLVRERDRIPCGPNP